MKIYLQKYTEITQRINLYEMEKVLDCNSNDLWNNFFALFDYLKNKSVWKGHDKETFVNSVPSMRSWEVNSKESTYIFEVVQAFLEKNNIDYVIGYPDY